MRPGIPKKKKQLELPLIPRAGLQYGEFKLATSNPPEEIRMSFFEFNMIGLNFDRLAALPWGLVTAGLDTTVRRHRLH